MLQRGCRFPVPENLLDQDDELRWQRRPSQREPLDDIGSEVDRVGEKSAERLTNRIAVDDHASHVELCGNLNDVRGLYVELFAQSQHDRHSGIVPPKVKDIALERLDVPRPWTELEPDDGARAEIARQDAARVGRAAEAGVRRGGDGNRQSRWVLGILLVLHGAAGTTERKDRRTLELHFAQGRRSRCVVRASADNTKAETLRKQARAARSRSLLSAGSAHYCSM